ncbi:DDE-type integrase/transposase/recombinase [Bacillus thuringiensis]|uniref:DDE-type integrase/transposase/recombinase n=1 Tax=Bacillus thuringiensis TaxID=1428 RepID=UPI00111F5006|nr:DDE-type integrase/transposase/recombinase [Bacillus thuringiensis]MEC2866765.1 DDE-type integrase/transposase/recombinase [Bacillus cereus]
MLFKSCIDSDGYILNFQFRKTYNYQATYAFMTRLVKHFGKPSVLMTDKAPALLCTFKNCRKTIIISIPDPVPSKEWNVSGYIYRGEVPKKTPSFQHTRNYSNY